MKIVLIVIASLLAPCFAFAQGMDASQAEDFRRAMMAGRSELASRNADWAKAMEMKTVKYHEPSDAETKSIKDAYEKDRVAQIASATKEINKRTGKAKADAARLKELKSLKNKYISEIINLSVGRNGKYLRAFEARQVLKNGDIIAKDRGELYVLRGFSTANIATGSLIKYSEPIIVKEVERKNLAMGGSVSLMVVMPLKFQTSAAD